MAGNTGAPISTALRLNPGASAEQVTGALRDWLHQTHGVALEPCDRDGLMVEWRSTEENPFVCQLVTSDSQTNARRTITVILDDSEPVAIVEEAPFAGPDAPHPAFDLSAPIQRLLGILLPFSQPLAGLRRLAPNDLAELEPSAIFEALQEDLSPGLLIAVVADLQACPSSAQQRLLAELIGLTITGIAPADAPLLAQIGLSSSPRRGSVVSIARTADGLEAQLIASTSLRTKPESARRLVVKRQLSAPVPFDLERRRSIAMRRLLTTDSEIDLPTALQLLDEESERATRMANRARDLEGLLERAYEEQDSALGELDDAQSQIRFLQRAFRELGEFPVGDPEDDDDWAPDSTRDALLQAREILPFLVVGATDEFCDALDSQQKRGIWAKKIWNSLRALNDYCRSKSEGRFNGDIAMYRDNPPEGAIPLLAEYAATESKSTSDDADLVAARTFPVPSEVAPSGKTYMQQHLKIDKGGQSAPRIHLHDGSGGPTQRIYIGYVGAHLPTAGGF